VSVLEVLREVLLFPAYLSTLYRFLKHQRVVKLFAGAVFVPVIEESSTSADAVDALVEVNSVVEETATAADEVSSLFEVNSSVTESATGSETVTALIDFVVLIVEGAEGSETTTALI
jgi:hypothetical protein